MRRVMALMAGLAMLLMSGAVFAQADDSTEKSEFVEFDGMTLEGNPLVPKGTKVDSHKEAQFERLSDLKEDKDLMFKVHETTESESLK